MTVEPSKLEIQANERDVVTALLYPAPKETRSGVTLILGHGAGGSQLTPYMQLFAGGLASRGIDVLTFNFVYMERGRGVPDQKAKLESCYRAVIEAASKHRKLKENRIVLGGKSMGGRIASQVAAAIDEQVSPSESKSAIAGLVFLGYPLHPPGRPEQLRDAHLKHIRAPMLFVQGSRDAFGTEDEILSLIKRLKLPAELYAIQGGDHSGKVPKSVGIPQAQVYEAAMDRIRSWIGSPE